MVAHRSDSTDPVQSHCPARTLTPLRGTGSFAHMDLPTCDVFGAIRVSNPTTAEGLGPTCCLGKSCDHHEQGTAVFHVASQAIFAPNPTHPRRVIGEKGKKIATHAHSTDLDGWTCPDSHSFPWACNTSRIKCRHFAEPKHFPSRTTRNQLFGLEKKLRKRCTSHRGRKILPICLYRS